MALQYLETLKTLANGTATKIVLPVEFTSLLRPFLKYAAEAGEDREDEKEGAPRPH